MSPDDPRHELDAAREHRVNDLADQVSAISAGNGKLAETASSHTARLAALEAHVTRLESKVDTLTMVLVGFAVTVAGSAIGLALAIGAHP